MLIHPASSLLPALQVFCADPSKSSTKLNAAFDTSLLRAFSITADVCDRQGRIDSVSHLLAGVAISEAYAVMTDEAATLLFQQDPPEVRVLQVDYPEHRDDTIITLFLVTILSDDELITTLSDISE